MGVRATSVQSTTLVNAAVAINAETVIVTSPPISQPLDNAVVFVFWYMAHTVGLGAGSSAYRLRRGSAVTGTLINVAAAINSIAGQIVLGVGMYFDSPGAVAGVQYSLTCLDSVSTAVGAVQDAALLVMVL